MLSLSLSLPLFPSLSIVLFTSFLLSSLCPFRKRVNRKEGTAAQRGKKQKGENNRDKGVCCDGQKWEKMSVGKLEKELWSIREREGGLAVVQCWWIAWQALCSMLHTCPETCVHHVRANQHIRIETVCVWCVFVQYLHLLANETK